VCSTYFNIKNFGHKDGFSPAVVKITGKPRVKPGHSNALMLAAKLIL
jgi:hypothetical protein